ncbi:S41 family peptidase [Omnitrophica bacterium]|nr:S41 family peptidase [Candidatus Omnitrophota bacterium]
MRKKIILRIAIVFILIFALARFGLAKKADNKDLYKQIELFSDAMSYVRSNYVEELSDKDLIYGALKGMLASLDPYSQFMDPDSFKEIQIETKGEFGGLGIEISIRDGLLTIISPLEDTPADKAGIKPGDRIVKIDGALTKDISLLDAVKKLRGKPGTDVTLTILRENEGKILDIKITRNVIKIESIKESAILEHGIGYIRLVEFQERTPQELNKALKKLKKDGMRSLILDLRNNPGGLLDVAVKVSDSFVQKDKTIVVTRGRLKEQEIVYKARSKSDTGYPMVVVVNGGSASASEIVAGAIQDNGRGIILGAKTFGKGSVQTVIPLKDNSALRLTTAKYFTPSGRAIREEGIIPDVVIKYQESQEKDEKEKKVEEVFEKVEDKDKKQRAYDNQLWRAIDLLKGIEAYKRLEKS